MTTTAYAVTKRNQQTKRKKKKKGMDAFTEDVHEGQVKMIKNVEMWREVRVVMTEFINSHKRLTFACVCCGVEVDGLETVVFAVSISAA